MRAIAGARPFGAYVLGLAFAFGWTPVHWPATGGNPVTCRVRGLCRQGHFAAGGLCSGAWHSVLAVGNFHHPRDGGDEQNQTPHEAHRAVHGDFIDPCGPCDGHRGFYVAGLLAARDLPDPCHLRVKLRPYSGPNITLRCPK